MLLAYAAADDCVFAGTKFEQSCHELKRIEEPHFFNVFREVLALKPKAGLMKKEMKDSSELVEESQKEDRDMPSEFVVRSLSTVNIFFDSDRSVARARSVT